MRKFFESFRKPSTGIVWAGPVLHRAGYGNVSRNYVLGFTRIGLPVRVVNLAADDSHLLDPTQAALIKSLISGDAGPDPVLVVHYVPDIYPQVNCDEAVRRIGCTIFETDRIPQHWVPLCNQMDEIWVPSQFNRRTFVSSGVDEDKIRVVPYAVDTSFFAPTQDTFPLDGAKRFKFLYVSFWDWRKGFDLLLEAYCREFTAEDDVSLVIRTSHPDQTLEQSPEAVKELLFSSVHGKIDPTDPRCPHVYPITQSLTQEDLKKLYNSCDLYISTDRANGWGMPCMEAMAMGKPAATIDWSGSTEFMTADNSVLIRPDGRLVPVDPRLVAERPMYAGHQWAHVDVREVRRAMRWAYERRGEELNEIGRRGMETVRTSHNPEVLASTIRSLLPKGARPPSRHLICMARSGWRRLKPRLLPEGSIRLRLYHRWGVPLKQFLTLGKRQ